MLKKINLSSYNLYPFIYLAIILFYVALSMRYPLTIVTNAVYDDAFFISAAENILRGQWLGTFSNMTLIKGQGYAYFLVLNKLIGLPITLTLALFYMAASAFTVYILKNAGLSKLTSLIIFTFLLFQPALFPTRIIRDNIYFSLLLISLSGLIYLLLTNNKKYRNLFTVFSGLSLGVFWLTREEGVWVLPGFLILILIFLFKNRHENGYLLITTKLLSVYICAALVVPLVTGFTNYIKYGSFVIVDVKTASFTKVLNVLNKVQVGDEIQFLPVPQKKREAIYKVSPAFNELKPYFEGSGKFWTQFGCEIAASTCGDYAGGWFLWALRDGTSSLGYYKSPADASQYYDRISNEVDLACKKGLLNCSSNPIPFMPIITNEAVKSIPNKILDAINITTYKTFNTLTSGPSQKPQNRLEEVVSFLGNPKIVDAELPKIRLAGWYYSQKNDWISINCIKDGRTKNISIDRLDSPEVAQLFKDDKAIEQKFYFEIGNYDKCSLIFTNSNIQEIPLQNLIKNNVTSFNFNKDVINFDTLQLIDIKQPLFKNSLIQFYKFISIYLFVIGSFITICTLFLLWHLKRSPCNLVVLTLVFWVLYYSRIALVVMVDVTSFPAINTMYLLPAFPLWSVASIVSIAAWFNLIQSIKTK